jgi:hypothetical protein
MVAAEDSQFPFADRGDARGLLRPAFLPEERAKRESFRWAASQKNSLKLQVGIFADQDERIELREETQFFRQELRAIGKGFLGNVRGR